MEKNPFCPFPTCGLVGLPTGKTVPASVNAEWTAMLLFLVRRLSVKRFLFDQSFCASALACSLREFAREREDIRLTLVSGYPPGEDSLRLLRPFCHDVLFLPPPSGAVWNKALRRNQKIIDSSDILLIGCNGESPLTPRLQRYAEGRPSLPVIPFRPGFL